MFLETFSKSKIFTAAILIILGVFGRFFLINYIGLPNFEIITALTLVSAVFLGRVWALVVPLSIIAITDAFIGNSSVLLFTWSAFAIIGVFGMIYKKYESKMWKSIPTILYKRREQKTPLTSPKRGQNPSQPPFAKGGVKIISHFCKGGLRGILGITSIGIISSVFFFLYTNFGWWFVSNMYPHTLDGLIQCYIMGLPFFKNNLLGNLIFVPMASAAAMCAISLKSKFKNQNEKIQLKLNNSLK